MRAVVVHNKQRCIEERENGHDLVIEVVPLLTVVVHPITREGQNIVFSLDWESARLFPDVFFRFFGTEDDVVALLKENIVDLEIMESSSAN